jgi:hypothetical protein
MNQKILAGPLVSGSAVVQRGAAFFLASIGVSVSWPRTGRADGEKYNYGEIVSRLKTAYSENEFSEAACEGPGKQP